MQGSGAAPSALGHSVVFYDDDQQLYEVVAGNLADRLQAGDTVVVVVTPGHLAGFGRSLAAAGLDLDVLRRSGRYVEVDAAQLLEEVGVGDVPDPRRLAPVFAEHEAAARAAGGRLVVFSEMVTLLWERGLVVPTLELEDVGNHLLALFDFDLVCAYPKHPGPGADVGDDWDQVCARHSHVLGQGADACDISHERPGSPLASSEQRLAFQAHMLDAVDASVVATDLDGMVVAWSEGARRLHGWSAEQAIGRRLYELTVPADHHADARAAFEALVANDGWEGELVGQRPDGSSFPARVRNRVVRDADGAPIGVVGVAVDLSEHVEREASLARRAEWLRAITDRMGEGLCTLDNNGRIAYVNPQGEQLLDAPGGAAVGGSFVNRLLEPTNDDTAAALRGHMIGADFDGHVPGDVTEARLLRGDGSVIPIEYVATPIPADADDHANGWVVVFRDISLRVERDRQVRVDAEHAHWMARIQAALEHDRFVLHAQPIVDVATGRVVQHELLIRLADPDEGLVFPGAFLPTAEAYGLAPAIDRWVVAEAVELAAAGHAVELNLSARSIADPSLPYLVEELLQQADADPALLVFELTETALLENHEAASRFADRVHALGCQLALDDFGTGYGAFTYLKHLAVDILKVDIEFVRDAVTNPASRHVIKAVVSLARSFGLVTVAEGVEDQSTLDLLVRLGVDQVQGYHLGRPGPLAATLHRDASPAT